MHILCHGFFLTWEVLKEHTLTISLNLIPHHPRTLLIELLTPWKLDRLWKQIIFIRHRSLLMLGIEHYTISPRIMVTVVMKDYSLCTRRKIGSWYQKDMRMIIRVIGLQRANQG